MIRLIAVCIASLIPCLIPSLLSAQWSVFAPLSQPRPPSVNDPEWSAPVDAFVYAKLAEAGLKPAPPVTRRVWLRRVTYDLTGLPPTPESLDAFLADSSSDLDPMQRAVASEAAALWELPTNLVSDLLKIATTSATFTQPSCICSDLIRRSGRTTTAGDSSD